MKRLRHKPTVNPVVRNFAATAALLAPLAHFNPPSPHYAEGLRDLKMSPPEPKPGDRVQ
jgi:hypothetical protein